MKKILTIGLGLSVLASSLLAGEHVVKGKYGPGIEQTKTNSVLKEKVKEQNKIDLKLLKLAIKSIKYSQSAFVYLYKNDTKKAKEYIKKAIAELTDVLNRPNAPYLLPISYQVETYRYIGSLEDVEKSVKRIRELIDENKLPEARTELNVLRDEIDIKTVNIPLATFPAALKLTLRYINEGKLNTAKDILNMALSTLVEIKDIIPIPLINAEELVGVASKVAKNNKEKAIKYLEEAEYQLKLAKVLGYTSTSKTTYEMLDKKIKELKEKLNDNKKTGNLFEELIQKIKEFKEKAIKTINSN